MRFYGGPLAVLPGRGVMSRLVLRGGVSGCIEVERGAGCPAADAGRCVGICMVLDVWETE